jgi:hypothetical protein
MRKIDANYTLVKSPRLFQAQSGSLFEGMVYGNGVYSARMGRNGLALERYTDIKKKKKQNKIMNTSFIW